MDLGEIAARLRAAWRGVFHSARLEAEMDEEMRFHVESHAARLMHDEHLDLSEARRRALVAFGGIEKYKVEGRETYGVQWIDAMALDTRFGLRMLVKYRGLTLVGGFAMAVAMAIGATGFEAFAEVLNERLPFDEGDRIVAIQNVSTASGAAERRVLHDFVEWRDGLTTVQHLGAFRTARHNLVTPGVPPEPVRVAEISASAFAITRTPPLAGRYLVASDESDGSPRVVVIGYDAWHARFGADPGLVGRSIPLGGDPHIVVGIMPKGFQFPIDHQFWVPLRHRPLPLTRLSGPELFVFGRLAPGATLEQANAELRSMGERAARTYPSTHERLRPVVIPYTREHLDLTEPMFVWLLRSAQVLVGALTIVVAINLAILFYARTVTRLGELAVRSALGASRRRILTQLFVEALVLSGVGALGGLALADAALSTMQSLARLNGAVPFWIDLDLSGGTVLYAMSLTLLAAFVMGVLPGVRATSRQLTVSLHETNNASGTRLGALWTGLIVVQVAAAVAVLPLAVFLGRQVAQLELAGSGLADDEIAVASIAMRDDGQVVERETARLRQQALMTRLAGEPGVSAVTFSSSIPGFAGGRSLVLEQGLPEAEDGLLDVSTVDVAVDLFDVYDVSLLAGRRFGNGDAGNGTVAVVNESFVNAFLAGGNALGTRFRYSRSRGPAADVEGMPWVEIVGVVRDFPRFPEGLSLDTQPTVYHAAAAGDVRLPVISVRFAGAVPADFLDRVRIVSAQIDPGMQVRRVVPLSSVYRDLRSFWRYLAWGTGLLTVSVLLLSAAGIYAMMSFTVAQRTREIGIRTALGASPQRVLRNVFARAVLQLTAGVAGGSLLSTAAFTGLALDAATALALLATVAAIMMAVGLLAAAGPARRALRMQSIEALRAGN